MLAIPLSVDHCTASVYQMPSPTSPYPATAPAGDANPINNAAVNAKTNPRLNQTRLNPTTNLDEEPDIGTRA